MKNITKKTVKVIGKVVGCAIDVALLPCRIYSEVVIEPAKRAIQATYDSIVKTINK